MVWPCCCVKLQRGVKFIAILSMALNGILCLMSAAGAMTLVIISYRTNEEYTRMQLASKEMIVLDFSDYVLKNVILKYGFRQWIVFFSTLSVQLALHHLAGRLLKRAVEKKSVNMCICWMLLDLVLFIVEIFGWLAMFSLKMPNLMFLYQPKTLVPYMLVHLYEFLVVKKFIKQIHRERRIHGDIMLTDMNSRFD